MVRRRLYLAENITNVDCSDDLVLLVNIFDQSEYRLHHLKQGTKSSCLYVNVDKILFMYLKKDSAIFILFGSPLKAEDQFIYFGSNIVSIEGNENICIGKA